MKELLEEALLESESLTRGITPPSNKTLAKYGITRIEWLKLMEAQGWKCAVCLKTRATWNTDHEHVPGWAKRPPEERALYVRGILCWWCNRHIVPSNSGSEEAHRVYRYIAEYESRRDAAIRQIAGD